MAKLIGSLVMVMTVALAAPGRADDKTAKTEKSAKTEKTEKTAPGTGGAAGTAAAPVKMKWEEVCEPDMKKHCQAEMSGDVRPCLAKHEKELSKACTEHFSAAGFRVAELCKDDIERLCQEAAVAGDLAKCMTAKQAQLSAKCRGALIKGGEQKPKKTAPGEETPPDGSQPAKAKKSKKTKAQ